MNWLDYLIVIFFILNFLAGLSNGLLSGLFELARLVVSIVVAVAAFPAVAGLLRLIGVPDIISYFAAFLGVMIIVQIILAVAGLPWTRRMKKSFKDSGLRPLDRILGPIPQVIMIAISLSFFLALFLSFPIYTPIQTAIANSKFGRPLAQPALTVLAAVTDKVNTNVTSYSI